MRSTIDGVDVSTGIIERYGSGLSNGETILLLYVDANAKEDYDKLDIDIEYESVSEGYKEQKL